VVTIQTDINLIITLYTPLSPAPLETKRLQCCTVRGLQIIVECQRKSRSDKKRIQLQRRKLTLDRSTGTEFFVATVLIKLRLNSRICRFQLINFVIVIAGERGGSKVGYKLTVLGCSWMFNEASVFASVTNWTRKLCSVGLEIGIHGRNCWGIVEGSWYVYSAQEGKNTSFASFSPFSFAKMHNTPCERMSSLHQDNITFNSGFSCFKCDPSKFFPSIELVTAG
jgi:hypothetical protein